MCRAAFVLQSSARHFGCGRPAWTLDQLARYFGEGQSRAPPVSAPRPAAARSEGSPAIRIAQHDRTGVRGMRGVRPIELVRPICRRPVVGGDNRAASGGGQRPDDPYEGTIQRFHRDIVAALDGSRQVAFAKLQIHHPVAALPRSATSASVSRSLIPAEIVGATSATERGCAIPCGRFRPQFEEVGPWRVLLRLGEPQVGRHAPQQSASAG